MILEFTLVTFLKIFYSYEENCQSKISFVIFEIEMKKIVL